MRHEAWGAKLVTFADPMNTMEPAHGYLNNETHEPSDLLADRLFEPQLVELLIFGRRMAWDDHCGTSEQLVYSRFCFESVTALQTAPLDRASRRIRET